jgi:hypothetical protein
MDPFWLLAAEFWWVAPATVGAGALGAVGLRRRSVMSGKRLAYEAARLDLQTAQREAAACRLAVKVARAEHARVAAERAASRASSLDVAAARRDLRHAEQASKAAAAEVRLRRVRMNVARVELSNGAAAPLNRVHERYDAVTARWLEYETDPARRIAFPSMSDGRDPAMAAFLGALDTARNLRPADGQKRVSPAEFAAYRDAVTALERAFDAAERAARTRAGMPDPEPADAGAWQEAAQNVLTRSADVLDRAAGAAASAIAAWNARDRHRGGTDGRGPTAAPEGNTPPRDRGQGPAAPGGSGRPIWPVPRRDGT